MAASTNIVFTYKEVVEALLRKQSMSSGIWGLYIKFGIGAANIVAAASDMQPTAIVPVLEIGLQPFEQVNNLSVDAATLVQKHTARRKHAQKK